MKNISIYLIINVLFTLMAPISVSAATLPPAQRNNAQAIFIATHIYEMLQAEEDVLSVMCDTRGCFVVPR